MKRITRAVALFLALFLLIGLASCTRTELGGKPESTDTEKKTSASSGKTAETEETETEKKTQEPVPAADPYEIYRAAAEKTRGASDISMRNGLEQELVLTSQGQTVPLSGTNEQTIKIKGYGTDGALYEAHSAQTSTVNGTTTETKEDVFIDPEKIYYRDPAATSSYSVVDRKSAQGAVYENALKSGTVLGSLLPEKAFKNAVVSDSGAKSLNIVTTPEPDVLNEVFADYLSVLSETYEAMGMTDIAISVTGATLSFEIASSGYLVSSASQMELSLSLKASGFDFSGTDRVITVSNVLSIGDPVSIEIPAV